MITSHDNLLGDVANDVEPQIPRRASDESRRLFFKWKAADEKIVRNENARERSSQA